MKVNFAFHLEIKVPESGGRVERHRIRVAWSPVWSFHSQWWFGLPCHLLVLVHCVFLKSTVNAAIYQEILEHFHASFCWQALWRCWFHFQQDLAPAHTAKGTKSWFNDHGVTVLDWPTNSPDLNVLSRGRWETPDPTMQMSWRPLSKKPGLPYHLSSATTDYLHATPNWGSKLKQKEPLPSIEYIYSIWTYFPEGQQFTKNVFFIGLMKYSNLLR